MTTQGDETRRRILLTIRLYCDEYGFGPTQAEIGEIVGVKVPAVSKQLQHLQQDGLITARWHSPRSVRVVRE